MPFLAILSDIEERLTVAEEKKNIPEVLKLKKEYFEKSIAGNLKIVKEINTPDKDEVLENYEIFYKTINHIVLRRESPILTKQVNIFTTNIDIFSEKALENIGVEFNDGFHGRFKSKYDIGNFNKSYFKKSSHYENTSEIPVFNIMKIHGSISWIKTDGSVYLDGNLSAIEELQKNISDASFEGKYNELMIVNPTKKKIEDTLLNEYYYDLLRIYSNELEKEGSVLFVLGFSFRDKHIHDLTLRVANANPTLKIYIFSYVVTPDIIYDGLKREAKNKNIEIVYPEIAKQNDFKAIIENYFHKIDPVNHDKTEDIAELVEIEKA